MSSLGPGFGVPDDLADIAREHPALADALAHPLDRRRTLKLLAAALATGGLEGCDPGHTSRRLVSAVVAPTGIVPGEPDHYATAHVHDGYANGIVVTQMMGRPTKVEGNPLHPASLGATDALGQAAVLDFYDPDRSQGPTQNGTPVAWQQVNTMLAALRTRLAQTNGAGFRLLTGTVTSPTLAAAIDRVLARYPAARWHQWQPISRDAVRQGSALAYGRPVDCVPKLDRADVILAIDSDLLSSAPGHLAFARAFASRRNPTRTRMNRLYAVEPTPTLTGIGADHRFIATPAQLDGIVTALAGALLHGAPPTDPPPWLPHIIDDLRAHPGHTLIHIGPDQPAESHALVHAMNESLGARGATFDVLESVAHAPVDHAESMAALVSDMAAGRIETMLILDVNAVYGFPEFAAALPHVRTSIALTPMPDETAQAVTWNIPRLHDFETWSDARAFDGTATILQPQAMPLYGGRTAPALLSACIEPFTPAALDMVRDTWKQLGAVTAWHDALASGVVPGTASATADVRLRSAVAALRPPPRPARSLDLLIRPDPHLWDGRFANLSWLQELPRPLTKVVWDNPLLVSPAIARKLNLHNGDEVSVTADERHVALPVWVMPGQADDCVVALLGFGRRAAGETGSFVGVDVTPLRSASGAVALHPTGKRLVLASSEHHDPLDAVPADIMRHGTLAAFAAQPDFLKGEAEGGALYTREPSGPVAWGMSIDLNACIGCNACVVACQAENNIPVVGKDQVLREREMHWLRIDRQFAGPEDAPTVLLQPVLCMHCEQAPCEVVCPVGATVHDQEGLNLMVYNRCVGTRFCSNNCPYKVRRFNYHAYAKLEQRPPISRNPDVSVRGRGVMEKCTFCVQRIAEARIAADRDGVPEQAVTACQAACPTQAFTFGDMHAPDSEVAKRKQSPLDYVLLPEENTRPRVTYEARILNRNQALTA